MWWIKRFISRSPKYKDLEKIGEAIENNEKLVDVRTYDTGIVAEYEDSEMQPYVGERIFVRDGVAKKLAKVQQSLRKNYNYGLRIVYGYRHPDVQKIYFNKQRTILSQSIKGLSNDNLDQLTHTFVAVPFVAGHPTGGAVDLTLVNGKNELLDMGTGTKILDFSDAKKMETFASGLTPQQRKNRKILLDAMISAGFTPFYGEWWHFSYGDREWAWQQGKKQAIYAPVDFRTK